MRAVDDGIIAYDLNDAVIGWSAGAQRILGYSSAQMLGSTSGRLIPPDLRGEEAQVRRRLVQGEREISLDTVRLHQDGRRVAVSIAATVLCDADQRAIGIVQVLRESRSGLAAGAAQQEASTRALDQPVHADSAILDFLEAAQPVSHLAPLADLQIALDALPAAVLLLDQRGRIINANPSLERLCGYRKQELVGRELDVLLSHPLGARRFNATRLLSDSAAQLDLVARSKGGGQFPVQVAVNPLATSEGRLLLATVIDVTARRMMEAALRASEEKFRALVDASAQIVWTADAGGAALEDSPSWRAFTGQSYERWRGFGYFDAIHPDDRDSTMARWRAAIAARTPLASEYRLKHVSGAWRWTAERAVRVWVGMNTDITERKQAEQQLEAERNLLHTLVNALPDYIFVKDTESRFVLANESVAKHMGTTPTAIVGTTDRDYYAAQLADEYLRKEQAIIRSGEPLLDHEEENVGADGEPSWVVTTKVALRDAQGSVIGLVGASRDITDRRRADEALRASEAQLRLIADALPVLIAYVDSDQRYRFNNRSYQDWFGPAHADLSGRNLEEVVGTAVYRVILRMSRLL